MKRAHGKSLLIVSCLSCLSSEGEKRIHLTPKNLLTNFVWDEVTENCKFSHAAETQPA